MTLTVYPRGFELPRLETTYLFPNVNKAKVVRPQRKTEPMHSVEVPPTSSSTAITHSVPKVESTAPFVPPESAQESERSYRPSKKVQQAYDNLKAAEASLSQQATFRYEHMDLEIIPDALKSSPRPTDEAGLDMDIVLVPDNVIVSTTTGNIDGSRVMSAVEKVPEMLRIVLACLPTQRAPTYTMLVGSSGLSTNHPRSTVMHSTLKRFGLLHAYVLIYFFSLISSFCQMAIFFLSAQTQLSNAQPKRNRIRHRHRHLLASHSESPDAPQRLRTAIDAAPKSGSVDTPEPRSVVQAAHDLEQPRVSLPITGVMHQDLQPRVSDSDTISGTEMSDGEYSSEEALESRDGGATSEDGFWDEHHSAAHFAGLGGASSILASTADDDRLDTTMRPEGVEGSASDAAVTPSQPHLVSPPPSSINEGGPYTTEARSVASEDFYDRGSSIRDDDDPYGHLLEFESMIGRDDFSTAVVKRELGMPFDDTPFDARFTDLDVDAFNVMAHPKIALGGINRPAKIVNRTPQVDDHRLFKEWIYVADVGAMLLIPPALEDAVYKGLVNVSCSLLFLACRAR